MVDAWSQIGAPGLNHWGSYPAISLGTLECLHSIPTGTEGRYCYRWEFLAARLAQMFSAEIEQKLAVDTSLFLSNIPRYQPERLQLPMSS
jgi:hypothetical protein